MNTIEVAYIPTDAIGGQTLTPDDSNPDDAIQLPPDQTGPGPRDAIEIEPAKIQKTDPTQTSKPEHKRKKRKRSGSKSERPRNLEVEEKNRRHRDNMNIARGLIFRHKGGVSFVPGPKPESKSKKKKSKKR